MPPQIPLTLDPEKMRNLWRVAKGLGVIGQPRPQYYFERSLSLLLGEFFRAGLVLDGLEEPILPSGQGKRPFSWENFPEIPPALVVRMRVRR